MRSLIRTPFYDYNGVKYLLLRLRTSIQLIARILVYTSFTVPVQILALRDVRCGGVDVLLSEVFYERYRPSQFLTDWSRVILNLI